MTFVKDAAAIEVKAFLDTSVLVATFYGDHEHHLRSLDLFLRFGKREASCDAHSLAEVYAILTRMPGVRRASGADALLFLQDICDRLTVVPLDEGEYLDSLQRAAGLGLAGGAIYDALLGHCALKAHAEVIYTWNLKHFRRLERSIADRVREPE